MMILQSVLDDPNNIFSSYTNNEKTNTHTKKIVSRYMTQSQHPLPDITVISRIISILIK